MIVFNLNIVGTLSVLLILYTLSYLHLKFVPDTPSLLRTHLNVTIIVKKKTKKEQKQQKICYLVTKYIYVYHFFVLRA